MPRPREAIKRRIDHDESRIDLTQTLVAETPFLHHAGAKAYGQHIAPFQQRFDHFRGAPVRHVDGETELRTVEVGEEAAAVDAGFVFLEGASEAHAVGMFRGFDLHQRRAVIRQLLRGDRARSGPGEVDDLQALEDRF